ncbi:hypothetical protein [Mycobacterium sp. SMC-4]|uniref:hypothetical protein n=1 Tax=Mycobacterium sp. SMC-4 TaxID=2857059 RepID=UPI003D04BE4A
MGNIIVGTEAVASGLVTEHHLRRRYRPLFPDVHIAAGIAPTVRDRAEGAWLWSRRAGIVTGLAAAALHGSLWVNDDIDVELIFKCPRPPRGIVARSDRVADDEWREIAGMPVATPARTAFDLGRFRRYDALGRLDALMRAAPYSIEDVLLLTKRYKGARGVALLKALLPFVDGGAESIPESWWRKLVIDAGFPVPLTQITVLDEFGTYLRTLDFGWPDYHVGFEYDGEHHQSDREQYLKDRWVMPQLRALRWHVASVVKEDNPVVVIQQLSEAMHARGWHGTVQVPRYAYRRWA